MFDNYSDDNNKPIAYFLTQDFFSDHVEELVEEFDKNSIPYVLQKETDTLGKPLDQRYFVVVDNIKGTVKLGAQFSSLLMCIVGYPRKGANKKNHYCKKPEQVVSKYINFLRMPEFQKTIYTTSAIKSKSNLKTVKSIPRSKASSQLLHNRSQSVSSQSINNSLKSRVLTVPDDNSKVYLVLLQQPIIDQKGNQFKSQKYNKYLLKIATNNPLKFKIIQNLKQLKINLLNSSGKSHYIVIHQNDLGLLQDTNLSNNKVIVFENPQCEGNMNKQKTLSKNIIYCKSHSSLVNEIRKAGFQAISLRDIDKSIIKYDNLCSKDRKATSKKIIWVDSQTKIQQNIQILANDQSLLKLSNSQNKIGQASVRVLNPNNLSNTFPKVSHQEKDTDKLKSNQTRALQQLYAFNSDTSKNTVQGIQQCVQIEKKQYEKQTGSISSKNSVNLLKIQKAAEVFLGSKNNLQNESQNNQINEKKIIINQIKPSIKIIHISKNNKMQGNIEKAMKQNTREEKLKQINKISQQTTNKQQKTPKTNRKIKRVKTQVPKRKSYQQQNLILEIPESATNKVKVKQLKNCILMPQEYCSPISPASQSRIQDRTQKAKQNLLYPKLIKRVLRAQSSEPSFSRIKQQQYQNLNPLPFIQNSKILQKNITQKNYQENQPISDSQWGRNQYGGNYYAIPIKSYEVSRSQPYKKVSLIKSSSPAYENNYAYIDQTFGRDNAHQKSLTPSLHLFLQSKQILNGSGFQTDKGIMELKRQSKDLSIKTGQFNSMASTFGTTICSAIQKIVNQPNISQQRFSFMPKNQSIFEGINKIYNSSQSIQSFQSKQSKLSTTPNSQKSVLRKSSTLKQPISILWKQFNFDIQQSLIELKKQLLNCNIRDYSFLKADQIDKIVKNLPSNSKIVILVDEVDLDKYLNSTLNLINQSKNNQSNQMIGDIIGMYIYQKSNQSYIGRSSSKVVQDKKSINIKFRQMLRTNNLIQLHQIIKLVFQNDYDDVNKRIALEIYNKILSNQNIMN